VKETVWAFLIVFVGITMIFFIYFFQSLTNADEHNYALLKETTEAAMYDAFDLGAYHTEGITRIDAEKFVEAFLLRYAENANLSRNYKVQIMDINESPPKVSIRIQSKEASNVTDEILNFDITNTIDAIFETPY
jgi:hypothetical protein